MRAMICLIVKVVKMMRVAIVGRERWGRGDTWSVRVVRIQGNCRLGNRSFWISRISCKVFVCISQHQKKYVER